MDYKKKIEIPFGAFDSELMHQEINIPNGFKAVIDGNKIILTRAEREDEKVRKALAEMVHDTTGDELWVDYNVHKEEALAWLEKQGESYTKRDVDGAWLKGMCDAKRELEKQGDSPIKWNKNTKDCKPKVSHSVLMKTTHGIAEGEWQGEYWHQYRWAGLVRDTDVLSWIELSDLEKQGEQKPFDYENANIQQGDWAEIPFGAKNSELQEATYIIPEGFHAEIKGNEVFVKKGEQNPTWSKEDDVRLQACIDALQAESLMGKVDTVMTKWLKSLKQKIGG